MSQQFCDVAVVGGGPAGCMAAIGAKLANPDLDVMLIDRENTRRHRIGEAMLTGTVMTLADAGLAEDLAKEDFHLKIGAAYRWGADEDVWFVNYPEADTPYPAAFTHDTGRYALHAPRHEFDSWLGRMAIKRDVRVLADRAVELNVNHSEFGAQILSIRTEGGAKIRARHYIDATGQGALFARHLTKRHKVGGSRIARYGYTAQVDWDHAAKWGFDPHRTNIIASDEGWFWVIHLGERGQDLTSIGFVSVPEVIKSLTPDNVADAFPELDRFGFGDGIKGLSDVFGEPMDRFYGHPDYSYQCEQLEGPNWALAGDAALFIDPILSQGVTLAAHYGFLRGKGAAAHLEGNHEAQPSVTRHYRNESAILKQVVGQWYGANRTAGAWRETAVNLGKELYGIELEPVEAFRWLTNLENLRDEYDPFPADVRADIAKHLEGETSGTD
ncbi:MAG: NAD(P)/FAD-dependent oxidoreductase [Alphaproteobacteria bacterium]